MATQNPKNQLALDLGDTTAKLTVRDLVVRGEIETPAASARKPKPIPTFERTLVDGADCALRRRCGAKSELLVLLATQGQAYVMDERTGRRHALTAGRLASFCSGAHDDTLTPRGAWTRFRTTTQPPARPWWPCSAPTTSARWRGATWCA